MLPDVRFLALNLPLAAAAVALVLAVKLLTTAAGVLSLGYRAPVAAAARVGGGARAVLNP